jgi:tetratricopeptide (TPR) repeat protein
MKSNNIKYLIPVIAICAALFASCSKVDDFLDERPSKSTSKPLETVDELNGLLGTYSSFYRESSQTLFAGHDDFGVIKEIHDSYSGIYSGTSSQSHLYPAVWDIENLELSGDKGWTEAWSKIFKANMVLMNLEKVTGSEELKNELKAEAHFIRAYDMYLLANVFCLPYTLANTANANELGLPLKQTTSFEESVERASIQATYEFIEADLVEALKITTPLIRETDGVLRSWRGNKTGVKAFAARYYLNKGDYTVALGYANEALAEYNTLVDYNLDSKDGGMTYGLSKTYTIDQGTPEQQVVTLLYPYGHDNQSDYTDRFAWKEALYMRFIYNGSWFFIPSRELLDLYDQVNDRRYEYNYVEGYSYDRGCTKPSFSYPGYIRFFKDNLPSGPSTAEMYLIKAECHARLNQVPQAESAVNMLRAKRISNTASDEIINLSFANQQDAISEILKERRRELAFVTRWYDVRRLNNNDDPNDDVIMTRSFYGYSSSAVNNSEPVKTYTLPKDSRRYATPIPYTELVSSQGVIEQNTYDAGSVIIE